MTTVIVEGFGWLVAIGALMFTVAIFGTGLAEMFSRPVGRRRRYSAREQFLAVLVATAALLAAAYAWGAIHR